MQDPIGKRIEFDEEREKSFQKLLLKYPEKEAALIPALWLAVEQFGYISDEVMDYVASRLGVSPVKVLAVTEFYTMLPREPLGEFHIQLCRNLSCTLLESEKILTFIENNLGIKPGGKTGDGVFSLELVECLGSCGTAPVMRVNDDYFENLTIEKVGEIIEACRRGKIPKKEAP